MTAKAHTEEAFEAAIVRSMVEESGWVQRPDGEYDPELAFLVGDLIDFVTFTQAEAWEKVRLIHGDALPRKFVEGLRRAIDKREGGALELLRHGFDFFGQHFKIAYFAPTHGLNPEVADRYAANKLSVVRQLHHDPKRPADSIDLGLFLNGLPVATAELKNHLTGQRAVVHARKQYSFDRDPDAPILRFQRGAFVHFAVDPDEVLMTTRLARGKTRFLPFNRGRGTGQGNPAVEGKHRTHYLWEHVWQRDSMLDLVQRFIHLEKDEKGRTKSMIFPRYHQWDCVRRLVAAARESGAGTNYLVQHSAGSGKSNSIAWLAHRLASLHSEDGHKVYDCVVVLTDRRVLDSQLQDTIFQFDHKRGVVEKIDQRSDQLAKALEAGVPIVISTIHKFGFIHDKITALPERRYAVIVDEAHSSQSGEMALNVKEILSEAAIARKLAEEMDDDDRVTPDQLALRAAIARGKQPNLSFFAFTATPKFKTLKVFGHKGEDGKPAPFHLYSMRQAIEEGFILDVLKGYTTYDRFFELVKKVAADPELDKRKAARALARFVNLHPTNVGQKVELVVEHFRSTVMTELNGQAKAMLITGSRLAAARFKTAMDGYIAEKGYSDVACLVAFSGEVRDKDLGVTYTEPGMNKGIKESELPEQFDGPDYNLLIVANKYQTGFDQPKLVAMYVDKRIAGIQAVQTLSRLNRTAPGKERTFVLDFVNDPDAILAAFQQFYEQATIGDEVDPQALYELRAEIDTAGVYEQSQVDGFATVFFKPPAQQAATDHARLNAFLDPAVDRFVALPDDEARELFRGKLSTYVNLYAFLAQMVPFNDARLEKLYAFARMLLRKLPQREGGGPIDLSGDVALKSLQLRKQKEGELTMEPGAGTPLVGPGGEGPGRGEGPVELLSTIIEQLNALFGTEFDAQDLVDGVTEQLVGDEEVQQAAAANDKANFGYVFNGKLDDALLSRHEGHKKFINAVFEQPDLEAAFRRLMLNAVYGQLSEGAGARP